MVEGCFNLKSLHGEEQPLPPASSKCQTETTSLKTANEHGIIFVLQKTKTGSNLNVQNAM
jgi:hypothetical protein